MQIVAFAAPAWHVLRFRSSLRSSGKTLVMMSGDSMLGESTHSAADLLKIFRSDIPPLDGRTHKGQHGRVGVVGGNKDYVGAPYFAATASLRAGGDLATVFCSPEAATPLKSLSPDLMITAWNEYADLSRLRSLIIGPGLGRSESRDEWIYESLRSVEDRYFPIVLDADALFHLSHDMDFQNIMLGIHTPRPVLTPNEPEFERIFNYRSGRPLIDEFPIVAKGIVDVVRFGNVVCRVSNAGSLKRVGGQGDILSGILGLFLFWVGCSQEENDMLSENSQKEETDLRRAAAAVAACAVTRRAANLAFEKKGRSLLASHVLEEIQPAMVELENGTLTGS